MKYYHATTEANYHAILDSGEIRPNSFEGIIYLADSANNACKFLALRHFNEPIYIFEIDGLDESKIEEQFDHNEAFFQCKAYGYPEVVHLTSVYNVYVSKPLMGETNEKLG